MRARDIHDRDSLRAWLDMLPRGSEADARRPAVAIAHRAAMRVLPFAWGYAARSTSQEMALIECQLLRACLISGVAAARSTPEIRHAVVAAAVNAVNVSRAAYSDDAAAQAACAVAYTIAAGAYDADTPFNVAGPYDADPSYNAANAANAAAWAAIHQRYAGVAADPADVWRPIVLDCFAMEAEDALEAKPLWSDRNPFEDDWNALRRDVLAKGESWTFWVSWYDTALAGQPQDWRLPTEIALIPSADWEKGLEHVNALIAEIVARREAVAPNPDARTVELIRQAVAANREALAFQIDALLAIIEDERERIRGDNRLEPEEKERLLAVFDQMRKAAGCIAGVLPEQGPPDARAADKIGSWAMVLTQAAKDWNLEAKKAVLGQDADPKVMFGCRIILGGAVAGVLTALGLPSYAAVAGGAILLKDGISDLGKALGSKLPGGG